MYRTLVILAFAAFTFAAPIPSDNNALSTVVSRDVVDGAKHASYVVARQEDEDLEMGGTPFGKRGDKGLGAALLSIPVPRLLPTYREIRSLQIEDMTTGARHHCQRCAGPSSDQRACVFPVRQKEHNNWSCCGRRREICQW